MEKRVTKRGAKGGPARAGVRRVGAWLGGKLPTGGAVQAACIMAGLRCVFEGQPTAAFSCLAVGIVAASMLRR